MEFLLNISLGLKTTSLFDLFVKRPVVELHYKNNDFEFIAWGDPILSDEFQKKLTENLSTGFIVNNLFGHYYFILKNKKKGDIFIGNSLFSILPVYYFSDQQKLFLSFDSLILGKYIEKTKISKRFILETLLFNYPLFNHSVFEDIKLLPANSYFKISASKIEIIKHTIIHDYFSKTPGSWRESTNTMSDIFISGVRKYFPDEQYVHALTGGFDGRTLVAAGLYYRTAFSAYCFGSENSKDTLIASQLASKAQIPFINIQLDDEYIHNNSYPCGKEFILNSSGTATFTRAHYLYSAKSLSKDFQYIITGNFGSEIFRAAHVAGAVISSNLYNLFDSAYPEEGMAKIEESPEFQCLNHHNYKTELESLREDLNLLACYDKSLSDLTRNQRFYVFVFEEIFRKYFGAEMVNQFRYIKNRTPFLDIEFVKAIFRTELAGIHSDFFEHNPFKRYKGQVLYAHIIKNTYPEYGKIITDKGYRPNDLINPLGKLKITKGYLQKNLKKPVPGLDPYSVGKAWKANRAYWESIPVSDECFNQKGLKALNKEILFKVLSLSYLLGKY